MEKWICIRDIILEAIQKRGITEAECADMAGISRGFFSDWKMGRTKTPNFIKFFGICSVLNISIDSLNTENPMLRFLDDTNSYAADEQREKNLIDHFRALDLDGKAEVETVAKHEHDRVRLEGDNSKAAT